MSELVVLAARRPLAERVRNALAAGAAFTVPELLDPSCLGLALAPDVAALLQGARTVVYLPKLAVGNAVGPDLEEAERTLSACAAAGVSHLVVISSAEVYGATPRNPGFVEESRQVGRAVRNAISAAWLAFEARAQELVGVLPDTKLSVLRPSAVPVRGGDDYFSRLLSGRFSVTLAGHDPSLQILSPVDLAGAIACVAERSDGGTWNVAPDGVIPVRAALELADAVSIALPRAVQGRPRRMLAALGLSAPIDQLDYIRYSWTVSTRKLKRELGFAPTRSSAEALADFLGQTVTRDGVSPERMAPFDDFGMDKEYLARQGRKLFGFLARYYWRIEIEGLEHVPRTGAGILAGMHRGLVAWDGVMVLHLLSQRLQRFPRFLVHPTGFQFPFVFDFTTKLGGLVACQENADYVLEHGELLGIFPEGIRGVFTMYRDAYRLRKFGRHDFVKIALRHGAPIIPFIIVGSAESYPIVGKVDWSWWTRKTEWPYFPITPTLFPLVPAPLPAKWCIRFLPPIDVAARYGSDAAKQPAVIRAISDEVKQQMESAIAEVRGRRKSVFFG